MRALVPCAAVVLAAACARPPDPASTADAQRIASLEERIGELERRLSKYEEDAVVMEKVMAGVTELLARLDAMQRSGAAAPPQPDPSEVYAVPVAGDAAVGPATAKVTMIKAFDFYCGYCNQVRPILRQLQKEYGSDLRIVFKHFVIHDDVARLPALAACAADKQGKFMPMFDRIFTEGWEKRRELDEQALLAIARDLSLEPDRFRRDMHGRCEQEVREDQRQLAAVGVTGTPAFYINGRFLSGARPIEQFRALIDEELKKATRTIDSGVVPANRYYEHVLETGEKSL